MGSMNYAFYTEYNNTFYKNPSRVSAAVQGGKFYFLKKKSYKK